MIATEPLFIDLVLAYNPGEPVDDQLAAEQGWDVSGAVVEAIADPAPPTGDVMIATFDGGLTVDGTSYLFTADKPFVVDPDHTEAVADLLKAPATPVTPPMPKVSLVRTTPRAAPPRVLIPAYDGGVTIDGQTYLFTAGVPLDLPTDLLDVVEERMRLPGKP